MQLFDSHAHYNDAVFDGDRETLLASLPAAGVTGIVNCGTSVAASLESLRLAQAYPFVYAAAGIHPEDCAGAQPGDLDRIASLLAENPKAVAVGEIGLDYHDDTPRLLQLEWFEKQLQLALKLDLPVIIHDREAHGDTMELLRRYRPRGVMHCYSGSVEMAKELIALGFYLGFTGAVTFKSNKKARAVVEWMPADRLLIETDCPYMSPEPLRGRRSDSSMLAHTLARVAEIKGIDPEQAGRLTERNARMLFGLAPAPGEEGV